MRIIAYPLLPVASKRLVERTAFGTIDIVLPYLSYRYRVPVLTTYFREFVEDVKQKGFFIVKNIYFCWSARDLVGKIVKARRFAPRWGAIA